MRFIRLIALPLLLLSGNLLAESVYVSDTLRVGVRPEPGNDTPAVSVVVSGMELEVIERKGNYMRIKTKSGVEGWVSNNYVTKQKTGRQLAEEMEEKNNSLNAKVEDLQNRLAEMEYSKQMVTTRMDEIKQTNKELRDQLNSNYRLQLLGGGMPVWQTVLILIALFAAAFAIGAIWYRQHVTKKLGGMSI